jgi:predicted esterase
VPPIERRVRVQRSARFFQVGDAGPNVRELWVACHGYGQLAAPFAKALEPLDDGTRVIVAPEGLSRFYLDDPVKRHGPDSPVGASWMTREDREHEIADYVEYMDVVADMMRRELDPRPPRIVAFGFSQGVATACRWAALGRAQVDLLIMWAGSIPHDLPIDRGDRLFKSARLVMVAGRRDPLLTEKVVKREHQALLDRGLRVELVSFDGGHSLNSETLRLVAGDA